MQASRTGKPGCRWGRFHAPECARRRWFGRSGNLRCKSTRPLATSGRPNFDFDCDLIPTCIHNSRPTGNCKLQATRMSRIVSWQLCVCLFVCNFDINISKKRFSCPKWKCLRSVDWWHHYVTWLYDVIIVTSQYSKSSHSETRTRINYPCGICGSYKHTLR